LGILSFSILCLLHCHLWPVTWSSYNKFTYLYMQFLVLFLIMGHQCMVIYHSKFLVYTFQKCRL
jgi:hypothetical protein